MLHSSMWRCTSIKHSAAQMAWNSRLSTCLSFPSLEDNRIFKGFNQLCVDMIKQKSKKESHFYDY